MSRTESPRTPSGSTVGAIPPGAALRPVGSPDPHAVRRAIGATLDEQCGYMPSSVHREAVNAAVAALDRWFAWSG